MANRTPSAAPLAIQAPLAITPVAVVGDAMLGIGLGIGLLIALMIVAAVLASPARRVRAPVVRRSRWTWPLVVAGLGWVLGCAVLARPRAGLIAAVAVYLLVVDVAAVAVLNRIGRHHLPLVRGTEEDESGGDDPGPWRGPGWEPDLPPFVPPTPSVTDRRRELVGASR